MTKNKIIIVCSGFTCIIACYLLQTQKDASERENIQAAASTNFSSLTTILDKTHQQESGRHNSAAAGQESIEPYSGFDHAFLKKLLNIFYDDYMECSEEGKPGLLEWGFATGIGGLLSPHYDLNGDGDLNRKENGLLNDRLGKIYAEIASDINVKLLHRYDKNGDGIINPDEKNDDYTHAHEQVQNLLLKQTFDQLEAENADSKPL